MRIRLVSVTDDLDVAAWIPAQALTRPPWTGTEPAADVTRIALPNDDRSWPAPPRWPSWYAGVWASGELRLPPGAVMVTGAAWRNRSARIPRQ